MNPALAAYPLLDALRDRRSRRFGRGMEIPGGPLAYRSRHAPAPLTEDEEAALVFAAAGLTGPALLDLCFAPGHGGSIMAGAVARTVASGDALQSVALFVINDAGVWHARRPQELAAETQREVIALNRAGDFTAAWCRLRVHVRPDRVHPPVAPITNLNLNRWGLPAPGGTIFLPVADLTPMYVNGLLEVLNEDTGVMILDERANFRPAGLAPFAKSRGGHLDDDPRHGKVVTIKQVEQFVADFVNLEAGMALQNLGLMTQALGLGGWCHFANHDYAWTEALGFEARTLSAGDYLGANALVRLGLKLLGRDVPVPLAHALRAGRETLLAALCPPNFATMRDAVQALLDRKHGPRGAFTDPAGISAWRERDAVRGGIARAGERAVAATVAYCDYVWSRYGRFPAHLPPFRTGLAHQAVRVDAEFYDRFYRPGALSPTQREEDARTGGPRG
jgi:hypothetical protein